MAGAFHDVACQVRLPELGWSNFEVDSHDYVASLKVHPGDRIKCVFINKRVPTTPPSTTPPSTQTTPPAVTSTPPAEVLGEKESATPSPTTSVLGEKLPFTGAPMGAGLILSLMLVAGGGALLLFGSNRRDAKHRG